MKIFVLGTRGFPGIQGGVETHCEQLYPRLSKLGCDITVFTRLPYVNSDSRVPDWRGVKFIHLWAPRSKGFEAIIHTMLGVLICSVKKPDFLHVHSIGPSILIPAARLLGHKVVMTHHGQDYARQKWGKFAKLMLRAGEFFGVKFAAKVIAVSGPAKDFLAKKYKRHDVLFVPNGVEHSAGLMPGEGLKRYGLIPGGYFFTACRFVPEKGLHDLIEAYKRLTDSGFRMVIAGGADHETDYSLRLKEDARKAGIVLTGFIRGNVLRELYSNAGLFVLPSYHEGLPIALLEALSYGLPVLVSDIPQNKALPLPDRRYFKAGDVGQLSVKMMKLIRAGISDEEKKKQESFLKKDYDWDIIARRTLNVFKDLKSAC